MSTSSDGGMTWSAPVIVRQDNSFTVLNDKEAIMADPAPANRNLAYTVWDRLVSPSTNANPSAFTFSPAFRGPALFSKTTDKGAHWSASKIIFDPGQNNQTIDNEITVVPATGGTHAGDLVDGFTLILNEGARRRLRQSFSIAVIRSSDGGATWSTPKTVSNLVDASVTINGEAVRTGDIIPQFTANPVTGALYAVWQDGWSGRRARRRSPSRSRPTGLDLVRADSDRPGAGRYPGVHAAGHRQL